MLVRWDPFENLNRLQDELFGTTEGLAPFRLAVDIREEPAAFVLEAEVAGLKPEDVKVDVDKNVLTISGERSARTEAEDEGYRRVERRYGRFSRSFTLPETVDADAIGADLKDGVLAVTLPKVEAPAPKAIKVKAD